MASQRLDQLFIPLSSFISVLSMTTILTGVWWSFDEAVILIPLMVRLNIFHIFIDHFHFIFTELCLMLLAHCRLDCFISCCLFFESLYIVAISHPSDNYLKCSTILQDGSSLKPWFSYAMQNIFNFIRFHLSLLASFLN